MDGSGILIVIIDKVNHSTGHKGIANRRHRFCLKQKNKKTTQTEEAPYSMKPCYMLPYVLSFYAMQPMLMP